MASAAPAGRADSSLQWGRDRSVAEMASLLRDVCETVRLQWGRDRSVAEMRAGCNGARVVRGASMGPRPIGRGNHRAGADTHRRRRASMGPRPIGRGNSAAGDAGALVPRRFNGAATDRSRKCGGARRRAPGRCGFNGAATDRSRKFEDLHRIDVVRRASMGPRPIGRGNAAKLFPFIQDRQLQWGRDRSVAEIQRTYATSRSAFVLQWGRDRSVAEINKFGSEHWFDDGFNGAATDRSRKSA